MASFFADSYAIIEILKGNENYRPYQAVSLVATEFNICEVAFAVCRDYPDKTLKVMALVRKMVVLKQTTDEDYCSGAAMRRTTTSAGKKLPRSIAQAILWHAGLIFRSSPGTGNSRISMTLNLSGEYNITRVFPKESFFRTG